MTVGSGRDERRKFLMEEWDRFRRLLHERHDSGIVDRDDTRFSGLAALLTIAMSIDDLYELIDSFDKGLGR